MALVIADRVQQTSVTAGTGTLTLNGTVTGYQSFSAIGDGNTTYYTIFDPTTGAWEVGLGTYTASGTTLSRTTVLSSSNAGALVSFAANIKSVFSTYPAGKAIYEDAAGNVGIGAEPSAWGSTSEVIEFPGGVSVSGFNSTTLFLASNVYFDGTNWRYKTTAAAALMGVTQGNVVMYSAPSGTAGAIATFLTLLLANSTGVYVTGTGSTSLGYATGAGGTVAQATSRTTGVTLNKPTGAITMFSAAGSATAASFTVTNSNVAAEDTVLLSQRSGTNLYELNVTAVAAGSFRITFKTTGGTAIDAPVINFTIIKGATA